MVIIMNNKINSLKDLYQLLLPALKSKKYEMHRLKYLHICEKDIWNYMKENVWTTKTNLTLFDMVNDILNTSNNEIGAYVASLICEEKVDLKED